MVVRLLAIGLAVCTPVISIGIAAAWADTVSVSPSTAYPLPATMPPREQELLAIFDEAAKRYRRSRTAGQKADTVIAMEIAVANFMEKGQDAVDWLGVVKNIHTTPDGDVGVAIGIAPGIIVSTYDDHLRDSDAHTLIHKYSPVWPAAAGLAIEKSAVFSATMLILQVSNNDEMIEQPHIIAQFKSLKTSDTVQ